MRISLIPYGNAPKVVGSINLHPSEHMIYLYLPIIFPEKCGIFGMYLPKNLEYARTMMSMVLCDATQQLGREEYFKHYVYVTAKTMWVEPGAPGNRPGWHADGYGSGGDLNYIWYDMNPTQFAEMHFRRIPDDDIESMKEMEKQIENFSQWGNCIREYPARTLLRLDESVVHRVHPDPQPGLRTFIKVSVSKHRYNLKGNSHNYLIDYNWEMHDRMDIRNTDNKDFVNG